MEANKVRKIIFTFENRENARYDVNQSIKIHDLKKILETALQIPRFKFRLYHDDVEYTAYEESKIEMLFPTLNEIYFKVSFHPLFNLEKADREVAIKFKLGLYCKSHENINKFASHFCFDCNEAFCSVCHKNLIHSDHETIEKYDYLLDTDLIVERIFRKVTEEILLLKFDNQEQVDLLEAKLKGNFFDILRNLLTKIEDRARNLLKMYSEVNLRSLKELEANLKKMKSSCIEVLTNKKDELQMQNIIIDDSIVVNYYNTILEIHEQKKPIYQDIQKFMESMKSLNQVNNFIENVSSDLNKVLENILNNNDSYKNCEKEIVKNEVKPYDIDEVKTTLYKEILLSTSKKPSNKKPYFDTPLNTASKGVTKFHHLDDSLAGFVNNPVNNLDFESNVKMEFKESGLESNQDSNLRRIIRSENINSHHFDFKPNKLNETQNNIIESKTNIVNGKEKFISNNLSTVYSSSQILSDLKPSESKITYSKQPFKVTFSETTFRELNDVPSNFSKTGRDNIIYSVIPKTKNMIAYNEFTNKMKLLEIKFPYISDSGFFLENSSFLNVNGKIYITGGSSSVTPNPSTQLSFYDQSQDSLKILSQLKEPRHNHSMIFIKNKIYIVGGEFATTTEIYDIENKILSTKKNNRYEAVDNPILYAHKNYLYSFFGKKNGKLVDFVQRVNLNTELMNWEKVSFKLVDKNMDIKLTNSAIIPFGESEIFFFGGKTENGITNKVFSFNFDEKEFRNTEIVLNDPHFFNNSQFCKVAENVYCSFSANEKENLIKVTVDLNI